MKTALKLFTFIFISFAALSSLAQSDAQLSSALTENIKQRISSGDNPSIAIGIVDANGMRYFNYGTSKKEGDPVTEHTIYEIGSITKVFTAILLTQQVIDDKVALEDPIDKFLPASVKVTVKGEDKITLAHLSDHTSGLPRMPNNFTPANPNNPFADYTDQQLYDFLSSYTPSRNVGEAYEYSNLAQGLLGNILAKNVKLSYEELMKQRIAKPLEMGETVIVLDKEIKQRLAIGHREGDEVENWDINTLAGAGAIRSSTADMLKFLKANLDLDSSPLKDAMAMTHQKRHNKAGAEGVGLGWHIKQSDVGDILWHNGGTGGYRAFAGFNKETGTGVVVLTNSTTGVDDIGLHLLDANSKLIEKTPNADIVEVSEDILQTYVGKYDLSPSFAIEVTRKGNQLYIQATGQQKFKVYAKNDTDFFLKVVEAEITFQSKDKGVESLTLYQGGQVIVGKKAE